MYLVLLKQLKRQVSNVSHKIAHYKITLHYFSYYVSNNALLLRRDLNQTLTVYNKLLFLFNFLPMLQQTMLILTLQFLSILYATSINFSKFDVNDKTFLIVNFPDTFTSKFKNIPIGCADSEGKRVFIARRYHTSLKKKRKFVILLVCSHSINSL